MNDSGNYRQMRKCEVDIDFHKSKSQNKNHRFPALGNLEEKIQTYLKYYIKLSVEVVRDAKNRESDDQTNENDGIKFLRSVISFYQEDIRTSILEILLSIFPHHCALEIDEDFDREKPKDHVPVVIKAIHDLYRACCKEKQDKGQSIIADMRIKMWNTLENSLHNIERSFAQKREAEITSAMAMPGNEQFAGYLKYIIAELSDWLKDQREMPSVLDVEEQAYLIFKNDENIETHITNSPLSIHLLLQYCALKAIASVKEGKEKRANQELREAWTIIKTDRFLESELLKIIEELRSANMEINEEDKRCAIEKIENQYTRSVPLPVQVSSKDFKRIAKQVLNEIINGQRTSLNQDEIFVRQFMRQVREYIFQYIRKHHCLPSEEACNRFISISYVEYQYMLDFQFQPASAYMHNHMLLAMQEFAENN